MDVVDDDDDDGVQFNKSGRVKNKVLEFAIMRKKKDDV